MTSFGSLPTLQLVALLQYHKAKRKLLNFPYSAEKNSHVLLKYHQQKVKILFLLMMKVIQNANITIQMTVSYKMHNDIMFTLIFL